MFAKIYKKFIIHSGTHINFFNHNFVCILWLIKFMFVSLYDDFNQKIIISPLKLKLKLKLSKFFDIYFNYFYIKQLIYIYSNLFKYIYLFFSISSLFYSVYVFAFYLPNFKLWTLYFELLPLNFSSQATSQPPVSPLRSETGVAPSRNS